MRIPLRWLALPVLVLAGLLVLAANPQDNKQLQKSLKDTDVHASWIYNDIDAAFAEAKKTGKPLLVVFR